MEYRSLLLSLEARIKHLGFNPDAGETSGSGHYMQKVKNVTDK